MHPEIKQMYETNQHPLNENPLHRIYGQELAIGEKGQFEHIKNLYQKSHGTEKFNPASLMQQLQQLMAKERPHIPQLKQLAVQLIKNLWNIQDQIKFEVLLGQEALAGFTITQQDEDLTPTEITKQEIQNKKEVQKRQTINSLIHGAAIHQMTTLHHMAANELKQLDPQLVQLYDQQSRAMVYSAWFMPLMPQMLGQQGGEEHVEFEDEKPVVKAAGIIFPILLHELSKGVMEVLAMHGLPKDIPTLEEIYEHADRVDLEQLHYYVGPELWRRFVKLIPPGKLAKATMKLVKLDPDQLHQIVGQIVDQPEKAKEFFKDIK